MEKIIHYCWFGGKPLPKLAKKCIKSWKKYFPNFQIIEWNEKNFDINMTEFSKEAYKAKKWAFVSDVARIYALKNYGGLYFDTDMIVNKPCDFLLEDEVFAGWESEFNVAVGVLWAKHKNNELINKLWDFYCTNEFSIENIYSLSIPTILTNILKTEYELSSDYLENQKLKNGVKIYARDYFYPISCDSSPNMFTERTCMIHYYMGSWLTKSETKRIKFQMFFGKKLGNFILDILVAIKHFLKSIFRFILKPYLKYRRKKLNDKLYADNLKFFKQEINKLSNHEYVAFYNKNWLGTKNATKELFDNTVAIDELWDKRLINDMAEYIVKKKIKLIIFSAFACGWDQLVEKIKKLDDKIIIKIIWHGSPAMNVEFYDWSMFETIFKLLDKKYINSLGFVKKSVYEFFKQKGYKVEFIQNTVRLDVSKINRVLPKNDGYIKIGLYASGDRWVKNFYNQLGAASLFKNAKIDCIPINEKVLKMAKIFKTNAVGLFGTLSREKMLERLSHNDINFYVTFSECAPLIPLESLELGVPCITAHNHHYWDGTELEQFLIVEENDNMMKIYEKAKYCLENREKILELYKKWKENFDKESAKSVKQFLKL